jgi:glycyl-tRNA synthetase
VIEPAAGLSRSLMTFLVDAYSEDEAPNTKGGVDKRTVMRFDPRLAPIKVAVLPLSKKEELTQPAGEILKALQQHWMCQYDETASIGKRYRRQDEIGTPYCVTVDFETTNDEAVTVRDRDTMEQERVKISELVQYFTKKFNN